MTKRLPFLISPVLLAQVLVAAEPLRFPSTPPTDARATAKTFHVLDSFSMHVIAAEPQVTGPVAMTYDEDGRAYVCEMNDYPYTDKAHHKASQENPTDQPIGSVRLLEDTDGDGVFDKSTVFAEGLSWPTGVCCWKGGVFVTSTPDIWYLKDTNGDGKADVRQKVFTGFKKLNVQAVMNNPIWGLDHRIYVSGGTNGAAITRPDAPGVQPVTIKRNDFSFDPNALEVRIESGGARFGNCFDDWGNRFLCNIRNPCQHVVLPYRYLISNPYLVVSSALNDCAEAGDQLPVYRTSPPEPWREFRAKRWSQQGVHMPRSELVGAGVVTSSSGITIYRGDAYPKEYRDFAFVNDVAGNLFYRLKLSPDGITFKASQVDANKNFCTSDDLWFRPVNFVNAPDGCLHVCDMYREVIEHPWSIPDDIHASLDLLRGRDRGRIYRLEPPGYKPRATPKLSKASDSELAALLAHPNAWHRETAQRLLFERQAKGAIPQLRQMVKLENSAVGRVQALWALEGLGGLGPGSKTDFRKPNRLSEKRSVNGSQWLEDAGITQAGYGLLLEALQDPEPQVRRQAVRMRPEALIAPRNLDELYHLRADVKKLLSDPDPRVRLEAIQGHCVVWSPASLPVIGELCVTDAEQPQVLQAALLACAGSSFPVFQHVIKSPKVNDSVALQDFLCNCAAMMGRAHRADPDAPYHVVRHLILRGPPDALARRVVEALATALHKSGLSLEKAAINSFRDNGDEQGLGWLNELKGRVMADLASAKVSTEDLSHALRLLPELVDSAAGIPKLKPFLAAVQPVEIQNAALEAITSYGSQPVVARTLIESWKALSPSVREKTLTAILNYPDRILALLEAVESKAIPVAQISTSAKSLLLQSKSPQIADHAAKLFGSNTGGARKEVIGRYETALTLTGDVTRGAKVYETVCMVCHRHKDRGNDVGPNLGTVQGWIPEQILTNVLDPNREVSPNFALYIIETKDGRTLTGLIASETGGSLTLKHADGGQEEVLRGDIKSLTSTGTSLMPEGLEAVITPAQMADLIAYLREP